MEALVLVSTWRPPRIHKGSGEVICAKKRLAAQPQGGTKSGISWAHTGLSVLLMVLLESLLLTGLLDICHTPTSLPTAALPNSIKHQLGVVPVLPC